VLKLSVCIEMIFRDDDITDRIQKVKDVGCPAFEFWGWRNKDMDAIKAKADECGLAIAASVVEAGKPLVDDSTTADWVQGARESIDMAAKYGIPTLIVTVGQEIDEQPRIQQHNAILAGLKEAAPYAEDKGITLVLEPLNILVDHKGYFLWSSHEGVEIVAEVDSPRIKLLYDIYHQQIMEGNLIDNITRAIDHIGHFHVADVPGRNEPGTGEINYANVFAKIDELGYEAYVGLEYRPTGCHAEGVKAALCAAGIETT
jgi:hydroxypyruvate isomerase